MPSTTCSRKLADDDRGALRSTGARLPQTATRDRPRAPARQPRRADGADRRTPPGRPAAGSGDATVRTTLDHLGDPEEIVAEEFDRLGIRPATAGTLEWIVVVLLPLGALLIPVLGWVVAVMLLWASRVWTTREKLIGTFLPPGGLSAIVLALFVVGSGGSCTSSGGAGQATVEHCTNQGSGDVIGIALLVAFVIAGIGTPIFRARRATASRAR
jgi:hypothetical protein